jgi:hypothetical protein
MPQQNGNRHLNIAQIAQTFVLVVLTIQLILVHFPQLISIINHLIGNDQQSQLYIDDNGFQGTGTNAIVNDGTMVTRELDTLSPAMKEVFIYLWKALTNPAILAVVGSRTAELATRPGTFEKEIAGKNYVVQKADCEIPYGPDDSGTATIACAEPKEGYDYLVERFCIMLMVSKNNTLFGFLFTTMNLANGIYNSCFALDPKKQEALLKAKSFFTVTLGTASMANNLNFPSALSRNIRAGFVKLYAGTSNLFNAVVEELYEKTEKAHKAAKSH